VAVLDELAAANAAAERRLTELRDLAGEIHDLLLGASSVTVAGQVDVASAVVPPAAPAVAAPPPVLLLVENSRTARTVQKHLLEHAGYEVRTAEHGIEAWELLQEDGNVSVVISDALMPEMDGFELTERIRGHPRLRWLPVILITATDSPERRQRSAQVGADGYIIKGSAEHRDLTGAIERLTREQ
jgi:CheY-like chemotaxis protein